MEKQPTCNRLMLVQFQHGAPKVIMYQCSECKKGFDSAKALAGHITSAHKPKVECPICHKMLMKANYKRHAEAHKKFQVCKGCGKPMTKFSAFCSKNCAASCNNKARKEKRLCENCGRELTYRQKKYCSTTCCSAKFRNKDKETFLNGNIVTTSALRKHLISTRGNKCEICSTSMWLEKELVLVVDHINGNADDNRPDNLRLLCPNCDSQTDTYKGRNAGKGRYSRRLRYSLGKSY